MLLLQRIQQQEKQTRQRHALKKTYKSQEELQKMYEKMLDIKGAVGSTIDGGTAISIDPMTCDGGTAFTTEECEADAGTV